MEDDVKSRFDETDKRLASTEKRIDDVKWFIGGIASLLTVVFGIITLVMSWNYGNERASLRDFQQNLRAELGKAEQLPELVILGENGVELNGQDIDASVVKDKDGYPKISFSWIVRNRGLGATGPLNQKLYTKKPLIQFARSTDEPDFQFESYLEPKDIQPAELPGQYSSMQVTSFYLLNNVPPQPGKHFVAIKVFYGKGKVVRSTFTLVIPKV
jgi:hypothetical protein